MNKYIFPGADASCALNWVIGKVEGANFEVKSVDVLGVHCTWLIVRFTVPGQVRANKCLSLCLQTLLPSGDGTKTGRATRRAS